MLNFLRVGHTNRKEMKDKLKALGYASNAKSKLQSCFTKISEGNVYGLHQILYTEYCKSLIFSEISILDLNTKLKGR